MYRNNARFLSLFTPNTDPATPATDGPGAGGGAGAPQQQPPNADKGFPENTPLANMTTEQQLAYYKFHNRQADNKLAGFHGFTPDDVDTLWKRLVEQDEQQLSANDRALKDAEKSGRTASDAEWGPKYLRSEMKALVSSVIPDKEKRDAFMAGTDPKLFVGETGELDEAKVMAHLTTLFGAPAAGGGQQQQQYDWGQGGNGSGPLPDSKPGDGGRAEAERRRAKNQQQTK
ncbi:hypothetical protein EV580_1323 [Mycobacterium sp. BK086]|uniref:hypothetical protein n=1 Tax=Mycobacterium sp. BK086 TaxID=2512165 RepID=UPI00105C8681|nr:hypothetical protein [Mycobacterium sp. BK086]TDO18141.1 hypothetical protein EV580_1323 [Mycobacterium sp. BK086]